MKVKKLKYNWRAVGSTIDRDGAGEDYDWFEIGVNDVIAIDEEKPNCQNEFWSYVIHFKDWSARRVFNPNYVEYFSSKEEISVQ